MIWENRFDLRNGREHSEILFFFFFAFDCAILDNIASCVSAELAICRSGRSGLVLTNDLLLLASALKQVNN